MSVLRKFYEVVKSGKYNNYAKNSFIWSKYFYKICKAVGDKNIGIENNICMIFKNTGILNIDNKFDSNHSTWSPFILPKYSNLITTPFPFKEFIEKFGLYSFILALKKIVEEHD